MSREPNKISNSIALKNKITAGGDESVHLQAYESSQSSWPNLRFMILSLISTRHIELSSDIA